MAQALLVATVRQVVSQLAQAFDERKLDIRIILLAKFAEYSDERIVLASPLFSQGKGLSNYIEYGSILRELKLDDDVPSPLLLRMDDPVVIALQRNPGAIEDTRGLPIGFQFLGSRYLEDGYVFRVRT